MCYVVELKIYATGKWNLLDLHRTPGLFSLAHFQVPLSSGSK
jgi:hypothetical protein